MYQKSAKYLLTDIRVLALVQNARIFLSIAA